MSFDFSSLLAPKRTKSAELVEVGPITSEPAPPPEVIGRRMSESEIIELWEERASIIHEGNAELVQWFESQEFTTQKTWRYCELCAAADMSLTHGSYVESTIFKEIKGTKNAIAN